jgi:hypothetical protein
MRVFFKGRCHKIPVRAVPPLFVLLMMAAAAGDELV